MVGQLKQKKPKYPADPRTDAIIKALWSDREAARAKMYTLDETIQYLEEHPEFMTFYHIVRPYV